MGYAIQSPPKHKNQALSEAAQSAAQLLPQSKTSSASANTRSSTRSAGQPEAVPRQPISPGESSARRLANPLAFPSGNDRKVNFCKPVLEHARFRASKCTIETSR